MALMASMVFGMKLPLNTGKPVVELKTNIFGNDFSAPLPNSTWHHTTTMAKTKELFNETVVLKALNDVEKALLYAEKITLKTIKPVSLNELVSIKDFLLFYINTALMCIDSKSYLEVVNVEITIL